MEWRDEGLILSVRKHGETSVIASLLTQGQGRHVGLVRGGQSRRRQGLLQPGNLVSAHWRARLPEHLGTLTLEPVHDFAAMVLDDSRRLKALASVTGLIENALAERDPHPELYAATLAFMHLLEEAEPGTGGAPPPWIAAYVRWELGLLAGLGFGLDLTACAATGVTEGLCWVSPRTGRAVSAEAGEPYRDRLLPLPAFLAAPETAPPPDYPDIAAGLRLTGHFMAEAHFGHDGRHPVPGARSRLVEAVVK